MMKEKMEKMGLKFTTYTSKSYNELSFYLMGAVMQIVEDKENIILIIDSETKETIAIQKEDYEKMNMSQDRMEKMGFDLYVWGSEDYTEMAFQLMAIARGFKEVEEKVILVVDFETKEITSIFKSDWEKLFKEEIF